MQELQNGILLGDISEIHEDITQNFRTSSIYHILAVSGTHVGVILIGITTTLSKLRMSKNKIHVICIIFLFVFSSLTGFTASVIRACIMAGLSILAKIVHRKSNLINNFCISLLITLIYNPYNIKNISVLLSYGGVIRNIIFFGNSK